jgi:NADPH:quinone reductase-like Zn-dependent oxidoreductase
MTRIVAPARFGGPEVLALTEIETPEPGTGEVRVAVRAIGVNAIDWKLYSGAFGDSPALLGASGNETSGIVDAVGSGVSDWRVGNEVIVYPIDGNAYAEHIVVPATSLTAKPEALSFEVAAAVPVAAGTGTQAVHAAGVREGDTVIVHGAAGGMGSMTVQLARLRGARVIGTASAGNHEFLRSLGVEPVEYGPGLVERARALAPDGVDAAIDAVGSDEALQTSIELVADRDRIVTLVAMDRAGDLGIRAIGGGPGADPGTDLRRASVAVVAAQVAAGTLTIPVERTYPLADAAQAHRDSRSGHTRGKLVILP